MAGDGDQFPHRWLMDNCPSYSKPFDLPRDLMIKLQSLEKINKERDFDADLVIGILGQMQTEYAALVAQRQKMVDKVKGPFADHLKKTGKYGSKTRTLWDQVEAKRAKIADVDNKVQEMESKLNSYRICKENKALQRKIDKVIMESDKVKRELEIARAEISEKKIKLIKKEEEIESEIARANSTLEDLQEKLEALGFREDACPDVLIQEMNKLKTLEGQEKELNAYLAKYKGLPPNILEARKVIRKLRLDEAKLAEKIRILGTSSNNSNNDNNNIPNLP